MEIAPHPVTLVDDLRRGEREAFVRFYELYRLPVYNLVLTLAHAADETPSIVRDVFVSAYRQMLLSDAPLPLAPWTYRVAVEACEDYRRDGGREWAPSGEAGTDDTAGDADMSLDADGETFSQWADGDLPGRFAQALEALSSRHQAALVLSDVYGLRHDDLGVVFGVSRDGARSLLFRARESFRQAFDEVSGRHTAVACRLAEQAAAASVGRSLGHDEERKLRRHAAYCDVCRPILALWPAGLTGLALYLREAPLPPALLTPPVFVAPLPAPVAAAESRSAAAAVVIPFERALRGAGRAVASRAAAYAVAAVCLAATAGMALYVATFDARLGSPVAGIRQVPHGERSGLVTTPPATAPVTAAGHHEGPAPAFEAPSGGSLVLLASTAGVAPDAGGKTAGRVAGDGAGAPAVGEDGAGSGDTVGGAGPGQGNGKAKAAGRDAGKDNAKDGKGRAKDGNGKAKDGNGKAKDGKGAAKAGGTTKAKSAGGTSNVHKAAKASKPKAAQPRAKKTKTKQTGKQGKSQK